MNSVSNLFSVPREQWLSWTHLSLAARQSPQAGSHAGAGEHFFFWARNALYHALQALDVPRGARVLLPAYLCRAAAEPFAAYGLQCDFYDLQRNCTADFSEIEAQLRSETRILLAVHYFGFPHKIREFEEFCRHKNLLLFEDCAHVLRTEEQGKMLGTFGDASVFSYRKFLPMFDGAELMFSPMKQMKWHPEHSRFNSQAAKFVVSQAINSSASPVAKILLRAIEARRRGRDTKATAPPDTAAWGQRVDNNSASFDPSLLNQPITTASRWILRHLDVAAIARRRRAIFLFLQKNLLDVSGVTPLFGELPEGVCPWVYPLFIDGVPNAHLLLRDLGLPAVTWGGVRVQGISGREFPGANFLYDNLVFLPVHQNLSEDHLRTIVNAVVKVASETRKREPPGIRSTN
jgi:perosamine synthetase